jgi:hypothetical protein
VLDAGSGEAEIEKPNVQAWACSGLEAPDYGDANCWRRCSNSSMATLLALPRRPLQTPRRPVWQ